MYLVLLLDALETRYAIWTTWHASHVPTYANATRLCSSTESGQLNHCVLDILRLMSYTTFSLQQLHNESLTLQPHQM